MRGFFSGMIELASLLLIFVLLAQNQFRHQQNSYYDY
jgi:hypothetical protein